MQQAKVLVTRKVPKAALDLLNASRHSVEIWPHAEKPIPRETLLQKVKDIDGLYCLITEKIDRELLDAAGSKLKVVSTMSVGYDHVQVSELKKRGIALGNTPDVLTDATMTSSSFKLEIRHSSLTDDVVKIGVYCAAYWTDADVIGSTPSDIQSYADL